MTIRQPGDNGYIIRDIALGAGIEGYRAYNATGDMRTAGKAAVSGGGTIAGAALTGFLAFFAWLNFLLGFVVGEPTVSALALLPAVLLTWATIALLQAHSRRMRAWMAPQPVPVRPRAPGKVLVPRQGQQYSYDLHTGQFIKNW